MKIDIISDTHLDFFVKATDANEKLKEQITRYIAGIMPVVHETGDVLVIAGDLGHYNIQAKELFVQLKEIYSKIFVVIGNHDLYLVSQSQRNKYKSSNARIDEFREICNETDVTFLDGDIIEYKGVRFGGTAGWYNLDTDSKIIQWKRVMNDSRMIYSGKEKPIHSMYQYHNKITADWDTQSFYEKELNNLKKIAEEKIDVLITHIAQVSPPKSEMPLEYHNDVNNIFFYTNNRDIVQSSGCKVHIFGHSHDFYDWQEKDIRYICNPKGYPHEANHTIVKQIIV